MDKDRVYSFRAEVKVYVEADTVEVAREEARQGLKNAGMDLVGQLVLCEENQ